MGEVFLAERLADHAQVVIKRVLPALARQTGFVDAFLDEVRVLSRLDHPNIVKVFDFGEVQGAWFLCMEWVDGVDLRARQPVPLAEALRVTYACAQALNAAHTLRDSRGKATPVVHRDVSPHNLLVARDRSVKLIDFGIASLSGQGTVGGKLAYAAPEQLMDEVTSPLSDQYSLGVVLWECLAQKRAFDGQDVEVIRRVTEVGLPRLPHAPAPLADLVARMTAMDPSARFASMAEVIETMRPHLTVEDRAIARSGVLPSVMPLKPSSPSKTLVRLSSVELAALAVLRDGMSAEEAEAAIDAAQLEGSPFALDVLQDLLEKGAVRAEDVGGVRRFRK